MGWPIHENLVAGPPGRGWKERAWRPTVATPAAGNAIQIVASVIHTEHKLTDRWNELGTESDHCTRWSPGLNTSWAPSFHVGRLTRFASGIHAQHTGADSLLSSDPVIVVSRRLVRRGCPRPRPNGNPCCRSSFVTVQVARVAVPPHPSAVPPYLNTAGLMPCRVGTLARRRGLMR